MKIVLHSLIWISFISIFLACSKEEGVQSFIEENADYSNWLLPVLEVQDGGPGKDGIPSINNPQFDLIDETTYLEENDLVLIFNHAGQIRIYPHAILDWHEIVNDKIADKAFAITYCPLTGTASVWDRNIRGVETTFGVSGLLYNANLIPYDRETNSNWSQMNLKCVNGDLIGEDVKDLQILETKWSTAKTWFPNAMVLNQQTGYKRDYGNYPYGLYRTNDRLLFPISREDIRRPLKERVLGIISKNLRAKAYTFDSFEKKGLVKDIFGNEQLMILGSAEEDYMVAYIKPPGLEFELFENETDPTILLVDNENNKWNIFGTAVEGPRSGEQLKSPPAFIGYWFSLGTFYPELEIY